jgi:hypothetical protein
MEADVFSLLEVEDALPTSPTMVTLQRWNKPQNQWHV